MAGATNDCLCCDSLKLSSILAKLELFLWIILFVVNFVIQKDLKDPIWLAGSVSIFIFLLINTGMQIYALSSKNFCLILSCGLVTLFVIVFANSALIYYISSGYHIDLQQSSSILESMENNQVTYLSIGVPILLYNVLKAGLLFKSAHKLETYLMNQNHVRPQYNSQISIPKPDFQDLRTFGGVPPRYYNEFESANQNLHPVYPTGNFGPNNIIFQQQNYQNPSIQQ